MSYDRAFAFIPVADKNPANGVASGMDFDTGGANTFGRLGLSATGSPPATHYGCDTVIRQSNAAQLPALKSAHPTWRYYLESDGWTLDSALTDASLSIIHTDPT